MTGDKPSISDTVRNTDSVVHETWQELAGEGGIGEVVDHTKETVESISKRVNTLVRHQIEFEKMIKIAIAEEVKTQIDPLMKKLDEFLLKDPKVIYIKLRIPNPFKWFVNITYGRWISKQRTKQS